MVSQVIQQRWRLSLVMFLVISTSNAQERDATTPQHRSMQRRAPVRDVGRNFQVTAPSYIETERQNLVVQELDYSCGTACLATVAKYFWGDDYNEAKFIEFSFQVLSQEEFQNRVKTGLTMADLKAIAEKAGYFSTVGRLTFDQLTKSKIPVIVGITVNKYKHFVVLTVKVFILAIPSGGISGSPARYSSSSGNANWC